MRKICVCIVLSVLSFIFFMAEARVIRGYSTVGVKPLSIVVDSIDYRRDLTRVYCKAVGRPHTSNRIDAMKMILKDGSYVANDIDGVDFKRYFQWEDEGSIPLEIDFPPMKAVTPMRLEIVSPHGMGVILIKKK